MALKLDGVEIMNRPVRVSLYSPGGKSQKKPRHRSLEKKRELSGDSDDHFIPSKKLKNNSQKAVVVSIVIFLCEFKIKLGCNYNILFSLYILLRTTYNYILFYCRFKNRIRKQVLRK